MGIPKMTPSSNIDAKAKKVSTITIHSPQTNPPDASSNEKDDNPKKQRITTERVWRYIESSRMAARLKRIKPISRNEVLLCVTIFLWHFFAISNLVVGVLYLDECPHERRIPVFLIVWGVLALMTSMVLVFVIIIELASLLVSSILLMVFLGSGWFSWEVLPSRGDYEWTNSTSEDYCHRGLYIYAAVIAYLPLEVLVLGAVVACIVGLIKTYSEKQ